MSQTALESQIRSQPQELDRLATHPIGHDVIERLAQCRRIWLVGTGTSFHAAELGAAMLYEAGRGAQAIPSMHFVNWAPPVDRRDGMVLISHSAGLETAYAAAAYQQARGAGLGHGARGRAEVARGLTVPGRGIRRRVPAPRLCRSARKRRSPRRIVTSRHRRVGPGRA